MADVVALTGGTGFVGRHLAVALAGAGWRVRLLVRRPPVHPQFLGLGFDAVVGDAADPAALAALVEGAAAVVHAAGAIRASGAHDFHAVNAYATGQIAAVAAIAGVRRFVLVSSLAAREPHLSDYAASKRAGEEALANAGQGLSRLVLRPTVVYGPWDEATLGLFRVARSGFAPRIGGRHARLSFVHVADLAACVVAALVDGLEGTFSVDDGRPGGIGWADAFALAGEAQGVAVRRVPIPAALLLGLGGINGIAARALGRRPLFTLGKAREMLHGDWTCDADRLAVPGWKVRYDLAAGFHQTAAWYRNSGWLTS